MSNQDSIKTEYYEGYDDLTADMVLEVEGGVKFRVHLYLLKAHSRFFRNMPEHDERLCGDSARQITFDATPDDLALLLALISQRRIALRPTWPRIGCIITPGERFQFVHVPSLVVYHLSARHAEGDPWDTFVLASKLRFSDL